MRRGAYTRNECSECAVAANSRCLSCHAAYMRAWRAEHGLSAEQRRKMNARSYAHVYLRRGKLEKQACELCGDVNSQMHHSDYSKPLEVTWLCRRCHSSWHKAAGPAS